MSNTRTATAHLTVKWDTDGEKVKLPKKVKVEIEIAPTDDIDIIHEFAMDKASGDYGWCIENCTLDRLDFVA